MIQQPLDDLEMFDLLQAAYPEKFPDDDDETWESAQNFADELSGWEDIAELLGRVSMLTMPVESPMTGIFYHCLGKVTISNDDSFMTAAVRREMIIK